MINSDYQEGSEKKADFIDFEDNQVIKLINEVYEKLKSKYN